jgi:hypothetical protein
MLPAESDASRTWLPAPYQSISPFNFCTRLRSPERSLVLSKQGHRFDPVTSTIYLPANQSVANSELPPLLQFASRRWSYHHTKAI